MDGLFHAATTPVQSLDCGGQRAQPHLPARYQRRYHGLYRRSGQRRRTWQL